MGSGLCRHEDTGTVLPDGSEGKLVITIAEKGKRQTPGKEDSRMSVLSAVSDAESYTCIHRATNVYSNFDHEAIEQAMQEDDDEDSAMAIESREMHVGSVQNAGVFVNQYMIVQSLGQGSFGNVKLAMDTLTGRLVAIKVMDRPKAGRQLRAPRNARPKAEPFRKEIEVMKTLDHPNVVQLIEVMNDPQKNKIAMVMEYVNGGAVEFEGAALGEDEARKVFQDAAKGLRYLHRHSIVHGDVKPDNLMDSEDEGLVKLTDFGSACFFEEDDDMMCHASGTPAFMCPEMVEGMPYHGCLADAWALAVTLWTLITGCLPFTGSTIPDVFDSIKRGNPQLPQTLHVSDSLRDLLTRSLASNVDERLTLKQMMKHPWATSNGEVDLLNYELSKRVDLSRVAEERQQQLSAEMQQLLASLPVGDRELKHGEYLYMAGDDADTVYYVQEGKVDLILRQNDLAKVRLERLEDRSSSQGSQQAEELGDGDTAASAGNTDACEVRPAYVLADNEDGGEREEDEEVYDLPTQQEEGILHPSDQNSQPAWAVNKFTASAYHTVKATSATVHQMLSQRAENPGEESLGVKGTGHFMGHVQETEEDAYKHPVTARAQGKTMIKVFSQAHMSALLKGSSSKRIMKLARRLHVEMEVLRTMTNLSALYVTLMDHEMERTGARTQKMQRAIHRIKLLRAAMSESPEPTQSVDEEAVSDALGDVKLSAQHSNKDMARHIKMLKVALMTQLIKIN